MSDKPILFSGPMVRAILREIDAPGAGKTQTRRVIAKARVFATPERRAFTLIGDELERAMQNADRFRHIEGNGWFWEADAFEWQAPNTRTGWMAHIGYAPGDRLWVREAWAKTPIAPIVESIDNPITVYRVGDNRCDYGGPWKPSIHMKRRDSRIILTVTDVRVQRLQDISDEDVRAEGIRADSPKVIGVVNRPVNPHITWSNGEDYTAVSAFKRLWNSINAKRGYDWDSNPSVAAYTFTPKLGNIDHD